MYAKESIFFSLSAKTKVKLWGWSSLHGVLVCAECWIPHWETDPGEKRERSHFVVAAAAAHSYSSKAGVCQNRFRAQIKGGPRPRDKSWALFPLWRIEKRKVAKWWERVGADLWAEKGKLDQGLSRRRHNESIKSITRRNLANQDLRTLGGDLELSPS